MPYGLAKGVSSVTDISDVGGLYIFMLKLGVISTICTDLCDGYL